MSVAINADGAASLPLADWRVSSDDEFAHRVGEVLSSDTGTKTAELRRYVVGAHSIEALISSLCTHYTDRSTRLPR